jgi:N-acetylglutamate synthase-like GNAT family acetyltransferase
MKNKTLENRRKAARIVRRLVRDARDLGLKAVVSLEKGDESFQYCSHTDVFQVVVSPNMRGGYIVAAYVNARTPGAKQTGARSSISRAVYYGGKKRDSHGFYSALRGNNFCN